MPSSPSPEHLHILASGAYTACDISDALLKLQIPHAGFLVDIGLVPRTPFPPPRSALRSASPLTCCIAACLHPSSPCDTPGSSPLVAPATTVLFAAKSSSTSPTTAAALAKGGQKHFADACAAPRTIAVLASPPGARCAVLGGLVATRLAKRGVCGAVVGGRVRDLSEMRALPGWEVWAQGVSAVGAGAETKVVGVDVPVEVCGVVVKPGDVVFADRAGGSGGGVVVVIPAEKIAQVVDEMLPAAVEVDRHVAEDLEAGVELGEALKRRRH